MFPTFQNACRGEARGLPPHPSDAAAAIPNVPVREAVRAQTDAIAWDVTESMRTGNSALLETAKQRLSLIRPDAQTRPARAAAQHLIDHGQAFHRREDALTRDAANALRTGRVTKNKPHHFKLPALHQAIRDLYTMAGSVARNTQGEEDAAFGGRMRNIHRTLETAHLVGIRKAEIKQISRSVTANADNPEKLPHALARLPRAFAAHDELPQLLPRTVAQENAEASHLPTNLYQRHLGPALTAANTGLTKRVDYFQAHANGLPSPLQQPAAPDLHFSVIENENHAAGGLIQALHTLALVDESGAQRLYRRLRNLPWASNSAPRTPPAGEPAAAPRRPTPPPPPRRPTSPPPAPPRNVPQPAAPVAGSGYATPAGTEYASAASSLHDEPINTPFRRARPASTGNPFASGPAPAFEREDLSARLAALSNAAQS